MKPKHPLQAMPYEDLIQKLKDNHFYPMKVRKSLKTGNILGVEIDCAPILQDMRVNRIKEVIGDQWKVTWLGNYNNYILITKP